MTNTQLCDVFLDSEFWQALGKSLGWNRKTIGPFWMNGTGGGENYIDEHYSDYRESSPIEFPEWKYRWHQFIDHLADGGTIDWYFEKL